MTNDNQPTAGQLASAQRLHDGHVDAIMRSVAGLLPQFAPRGFTPEAIFEGAVKGAAVALIRGGATAENVAECLEGMADGFRNLEKPRLAVITGGRGVDEAE